MVLSHWAPLVVDMFKMAGQVQLGHYLAEIPESEDIKEVLDQLDAA